MVCGTEGRGGLWMRHPDTAVRVTWGLGRCPGSRKSLAELEIMCQHGPMACLWDFSPSRLSCPNTEPEKVNDKIHPGLRFHRLYLDAVKGAGKNSECCHDREKMKSNAGVLKCVHKLFDTPFCKRWSHFPTFRYGLDLVTCI